MRDRYHADGHSLWDIGNGLCENFAFDVLEKAVGPDWIHAEGRDGQNWWTLQTDSLILQADEDVTWDWDLLDRVYGLSVTPQDRPRFDAIARICPGHVWIFCDDLHFDCEHPAGVDSFLKLDFFRRYHDLLNLNAS